MKAAILDADALRAIPPIALAGFARAEGWAKTEAYGAHADVYAAAQKAEIVVPRTAQLGDYASVVAKLIAIFADAAGRARRPGRLPRPELGRSGRRADGCQCRQ